MKEAKYLGKTTHSCNFMMIFDESKICINYWSLLYCDVYCGSTHVVTLDLEVNNIIFEFHLKKKNWIQIVNK